LSISLLNKVENGFKANHVLECPLIKRFKEKRARTSRDLELIKTNSRDDAFVGGNYMNIHLISGGACHKSAAFVFYSGRAASERERCRTKNGNGRTLCACVVAAALQYTFYILYGVLLSCSAR